MERREPGTDEHSMLVGIGILGVLLKIYQLKELNLRMKALSFLFPGSV